jgi:hypothetical protein
MLAKEAAISCEKSPTRHNEAQRLEFPSEENYILFLGVARFPLCWISLPAPDLRVPVRSLKFLVGLVF